MKFLNFLAIPLQAKRAQYNTQNVICLCEEQLIQIYFPDMYFVDPLGLYSLYTKLTENGYYSVIDCQFIHRPTRSNTDKNSMLLLQLRDLLWSLYPYAEYSSNWFQEVQQLLKHSHQITPSICILKLCCLLMEAKGIWPPEENMFRKSNQMKKEKCCDIEIILQIQKTSIIECLEHSYDNYNTQKLAKQFFIALTQKHKPH